MTEAHAPGTETSQSGTTPFLDIKVDKEILLYVLLIAMAFISRFYNLGERVMSHDETTHVYFSWQLSEGQGYEHHPLSHGPLQFHLIALSYFLFGDNDASARVPAAVFGVIAIGLMWLFRRWFGRAGALAAAGLILVSPFMLYYSRYARNEALTVPLMLLTVWGVFRYIETHDAHWLPFLAFVSALHFATKETAFIFTALVLVFLAMYFAWRILAQSWSSEFMRLLFLIGFIIAAIGVCFLMPSILQERPTATSDSELITEALESAPAVTGDFWSSVLILLGVIFTSLGTILVITSLVRSFKGRLRTDFPCIDLLVLFITMSLPQLASVPAKLMGWDPLNYDDPNIWHRTLAVVIILLILSILIGLVWNWRKWLIVAVTFVVPYVLLYSTIFTNSKGLATGLVGSLGYWLVQQGVERGSQPLFYYALLQLPFYEFLPMLVAPLAGVVGLWKWFTRKINQVEVMPRIGEPSQNPTLLFFLVYWGFSSLIVYSIAGERMPWITVHIALPFILLAGWGIGAFLERLDWHRLRQDRGWILAGLLLLLIVSIARALLAFVGEPPPFQGNQIEQLNATMNFMTSVVFAIGFAIALPRVSRGWSVTNFGKLIGIIVLVLLTVVTVRTSARAAFVNYDEPTEYMVYAHMARGPKTILEQVEDLAERMANDPEFKIAYDNESTYPFWWYLRNFDQAVYFGESPSRDLLNYPIILSGSSNWYKLEPVLGDAFYKYEYTRIWWPNMDYFNLKRDSIEGEWRNDLSSAGTPVDPETKIGNIEYIVRFLGKLKPFITDPAYRHAAWEIWFNRDYTAYGLLKNKDFSLINWSPSEKIRLYIRVDVARKVWDYGVALPLEDIQTIAAPYDADLSYLTPDVSFAKIGSQPGEFSSPHGMALAADGSLYITDTMNHRIQHLSPTGEVIRVWGEYGNVEEGTGSRGTFNSPMGIAVAPDGTVYVADTWNHRIQYFTAEGEFLGMFGSLGQGQNPLEFWGPRAVAIDSQDRVYVVDTGNKRVVIFNRQGEYITQFGTFGLELGYLDEPVGIAVEDDGTVFIADTWNQRVQIFEDMGGGFFQAVREWPIAGWYTQSLENKPYIAVGPDSISCVTDPEGPLVLCFDVEGNFLTGWGSNIEEEFYFGNPSGIAFDDNCGIWVSDSATSNIMHFSPDLCQD